MSLKWFLYVPFHINISNCACILSTFESLCIIADTFNSNMRITLNLAYFPYITNNTTCTIVFNGSFANGLSKGNF